MKSPVLSVIVPVYNVEPFLERCITSIYTQGLDQSQFEVIAINDCSSDNSYYILRKYEEQYLNFKVINHQRNLGLSCARYSGIKHASGKYLMHLDSDDWILPNAFELIKKQFLDSSVDVFVFNYFKSKIHGTVTKVNIINQFKNNLQKKELIHLFTGACWNKIVKKEILNDIIYGEVGLNSEEDLIYGTEVFFKAKQIKTIQDGFYVYCENASSITASINSVDFLVQQQKILIELQKLFEKYKPEEYIQQYILKYYQKWIILYLGKIYLWNPKSLLFVKDELKALLLYSKKFNIHLSIFGKALHSRMHCFRLIIKQFGLRMMISLIVKSFKFRFKG